MTLFRLFSLWRSRSFCRAFAACLSVVALGGLGFTVGAKVTSTVNQLTDASATAASGMFRFAPDLVRIAPGETVTFLNSTGAHTVKTQKGLWPEGAASINIRGQMRTEVPFDEPGIYGVICGRHGKYGMVMMVAVGDVEVTEEDMAKVDTLRASKLAKAGFRRLLAAVGE